MLVHTPATVWEDQTCPVSCDQWDDIAVVGSELPEMTEFSVGLNLSVEMYTPFGDQELFPMPSMDDYGVSMMTYTTTAVLDDSWQGEKSKKRSRSPSMTISDAQLHPMKRAKTDDSLSAGAEMLQQLQLDSITDELSVANDDSFAVVLPSPEVPRSPPTEPAGSPQTVACASPKVPTSPACDVAINVGEEYGEWGDFGHEIRPRTRAQRKRFQAVVPPTKKQRNKLARGISSLGETHLREVLRMVNAAEKDVGGGDIQVEFDIADVDDNLFYDLQEFVETCIQQVKKQSQQQHQQPPSRPCSKRAKVSCGKSPAVTRMLSDYHNSSPKTPKSASTPRKRSRKTKKAKASPLVTGPVLLKGAATKLTLAESALFQMEEKLTLAQTEEGEEDEIVDIGE